MEILKKCPKCNVPMEKVIGVIVTKPNGSQKIEYYYKCPSCRHEIDDE